MRVQVLKVFPFSRDGIRSETAEPPEADIPDNLIAGLKAEGFIAELATASAFPLKPEDIHDISLVDAGQLPADETPPAKRPKSKAALTADILAAADMLDPQSHEHFTAAGLPQVKALSAMLGYDITAEERDTAWAARPAA